MSFERPILFQREGIGNVNYTEPFGAGAGFINVAGARNGLSVDAAGFIVLGQTVAQAGNPAAFLQAREIPQATFGFNMFGGGVEFSAIRRAAPAKGVGIHTDVPANGIILTVGFTARDLFLFEENGTFAITSVNNPAQAIGMQGQRFVNQPLGSQSKTSISITNTWQPDNSQNPATMNDWEIGSSVVMPATASVGYNAINVEPQLAQPVDNGVSIRGLYYHPQFTAGPLASQHIGIEIQSGDALFNTDDTFGLSRSGFHQAQPTAYVHIGPSTGNPGEAPLKVDAGTLLPVPENGAIEYDGTHFYLTIGAVRKQIVLV